MYTHMATPRPAERSEGIERTTITLPIELARRIRTQARANERTVSSIVREALEAYFEGQPSPELPSFVGIGSSGRGDISERVEEIVAEAFRRPSRA